MKFLPLLFGAENDVLVFPSSPLNIQTHTRRYVNDRVKRKTRTKPILQTTRLFHFYPVPVVWIYFFFCSNFSHHPFLLLYAIVCVCMYFYFIFYIKNTNYHKFSIKFTVVFFSVSIFFSICGRLF